MQAFLYEARRFAISGRQARITTPTVDTNFDGVFDESDLTPFAYVFEIEHGASPNGNVTLRTYADFNTDEPVYFPDTDVLIKQKTFLPSELQITYEGLYDFEAPATSLGQPDGKTYSFSYDTVTKQFSMVEYVASTMSPQSIDIITIQMTNPDATRTNTINLFHLSGAPFISTQ